MSNASTTSVDVTVTYIPNDNFSNATQISSTAFTGSVTTSGYSTEGTDPTPGCGNGSRAKSAWYRFTPIFSGT
ncbi:MAG: hypothetical protein HY316_03070, partial [Acidobacteria bacterium]|nr:hypothetical protein [Acidobacteriota bacterium]